MSVSDTIAMVQTALDAAGLRVAELERALQDFDAELAGCDDERECGMIALRRMDAAFELGDDDRTLRSVAAQLGLLARAEKPPGRLGVAA